jgi:hypothetical protein
MELVEYILSPDEGMWRGYLRSHSAHHTYGESFEELRMKLNQLHPDQNGSISSSICSSKALLYWVGADF